MLTLETPEEQREILMQTKDRIYKEMFTSEIGSTVRYLVDDESELIKYAWNSLLTKLIEHGYTLPVGVEKE